jgi:hypothetical protein
MNWNYPNAIKGTTNPARRSFSRQIFASTVVSMVEYLSRLQYPEQQWTVDHMASINAGHKIEMKMQSWHVQQRIPLLHLHQFCASHLLVYHQLVCNCKGL